jgi:hypothetical protein
MHIVVTEEAVEAADTVHALRTGRLGVPGSRAHMREALEAALPYLRVMP